MTIDHAPAATTAEPEPGPASVEAIQALLPDHAYHCRSGSLAAQHTWDWTTPTGAWRLLRRCELFGPIDLYLRRGDGRVKLTVPATAAGVAAVTAALVAFGGLDVSRDPRAEANDA